MSLKASLITGLISVMLFAQCESGPEPPTIQQISGNWRLQSAQRNFKHTNILEGTFFVFSENGTVQSNLPIFNSTETWQASFTLERDSIRQTGDQGKIIYAIKNWSDSSLILTFSARGIPFELQLNKADSLPQTNQEEEQ